MKNTDSSTREFIFLLMKCNWSFSCSKMSRLTTITNRSIEELSLKRSYHLSFEQRRGHKNRHFDFIESIVSFISISHFNQFSNEENSLHPRDRSIRLIEIFAESLKRRINDDQTGCSIRQIFDDIVTNQPAFYSIRPDTQFQTFILLTSFTLNRA